MSTPKDIIGQMIQGMPDNVTDLFLSPGKPPHGRIAGKVTRLNETVIEESGVRGFLDGLLQDDQKEGLRKNQEVTVLFAPDGRKRFRVNVFMVHQRLSLVIRQVKNVTQGFEELNLPATILAQLCNEHSGLVLLTGPTGVGKSTTSASMLQYIANRGGVHVMTVEDPIEFIIDDAKSIVHQRQVGTDIASYQAALDHFMFQSPDVIFIGDIKTTEVMGTALHASESGPLVIANMHAGNVPRAVEKVLGFFPREHHERLLVQLSLILKGIISLRLVPTPTPGVRLPVCEVMILTPMIAQLLKEGRLNELKSAMEVGSSYYGCRTFEQSIADLVIRKKVLFEDAEAFADSPNEINLYVKGIKKLSLAAGGPPTEAPPPQSPVPSPLKPIS